MKRNALLFVAVLAAMMAAGVAQAQVDDGRPAYMKEARLALTHEAVVGENRFQMLAERFGFGDRIFSRLDEGVSANMPTTVEGRFVWGKDASVGHPWTATTPQESKRLPGVLYRLDSLGDDYVGWVLHAQLGANKDQRGVHNVILFYGYWPQTKEGPAGPAGPKGEKGATGATGADGAPGPAGSGATGATGATGLKGDTGVTGATGATGPAGPVAPAPQMQQQQQGPGGQQQQMAGPGGMQQQQQLPVAGARGKRGRRGATGATGGQGIQGFSGANGAQGIQGVPGPPGFDGLPGPQGPVGDSVVFSYETIVLPEGEECGRVVDDYFITPTHRHIVIGIPQCVNVVRVKRYCVPSTRSGQPFQISGTQSGCQPIVYQEAGRKGLLDYIAPIAAAYFGRSTSSIALNATGGSATGGAGGQGGSVGNIDFRNVNDLHQNLDVRNDLHQVTDVRTNTAVQQSQAQAQDN